MPAAKAFATGDVFNLRSQDQGVNRRPCRNVFHPSTFSQVFEEAPLVQ